MPETTPYFRFGTPMTTTTTPHVIEDYTPTPTEPLWAKYPLLWPTLARIRKANAPKPRSHRKPD